MSKPDFAEHLRFFQELGVTGVSRDARWRSRDDGQVPTSTPQGSSSQSPSPSTANSPQPSTERRAPDAHVVQISRNSAEVLAGIRGDIGECTRCKLHGQGRKQIVFGVGNPHAGLMFIGEAPGADEDVQGVPFVGRAGQLLTKMIEAMGLSRDDVYIANVIKCRPPDNRNPEPDEVGSCEPFLFKQVAAVQPKVIVALGSFAAKTLLKTQSPISRLRGRVYEYQGAKLVPTFHPSYLLRSPGQKREAWEDLKIALGLLGLEPPARAAQAAE